MEADKLVSSLLQTLENEGNFTQIRKEILNDEKKVKDDDYEVACSVFEEASQAYFQKGFECCRTLLLGRF